MTMASGRHDSFETRTVHAGSEPDPVTGAVVPPISLASTFAQPLPGQPSGFEYSRTANPTRQALERALADLEGTTTGFAFASGMAATDAVLRVLRPGQHLLIPDDVYGGTFRLVDRVLAPMGVAYDAVDLTSPAALEEAWREETALVWAETPSNPMLDVVDLEPLASLCRDRGARLVVDNTFATPYLQLPLALGAHAVVHSSTKYLGGHSDVVGGFVAVGDDDELAEHVGFVQNSAGAVPGPFDCYLVLRGIKTLALRMDRHCTNAALVAEMLDGHPAVAEVRWPGLPTHPGHEVAARQMRGFGGMISILLVGGEEAALRFVQGTRLFTLAESLGAVESLIEHPGRMTHVSVAGSPLAVDPALVRLSVGVESADDLVADLAQALDAI